MPPSSPRSAFDEDGYYLIGDAGRLVDDARPELGVSFDGRVAEDFKLMSGTWVSVGTLRLRAISALSARWPPTWWSPATTARRSACWCSRRPLQRRCLPKRRTGACATACWRWRAAGGGSSQTPTRALLLAEPPSADAGEITDKGYLNQRAVLARRASDVLALYSPVKDAQVVRV